MPRVSAGPGGRSRRAWPPARSPPSSRRCDGDRIEIDVALCRWGRRAISCVQLDSDRMERPEHEGEIGRGFSGLEIDDPLPADADGDGELRLREPALRALVAYEVSQVLGVADEHRSDRRGEE